MPTEIPIHGDCDDRFERVREIFRKGFSKDAELGASVCFTLDGEPVVDLWGGHCDCERTQEWQPDTLVNVYSTTKGMTAVCAHRLVELPDVAPVPSNTAELGMNIMKERGLV